jgi:hypothetical protein
MINLSTSSLYRRGEQSCARRPSPETAGIDLRTTVERVALAQLSAWYLRRLQPKLAVAVQEHRADAPHVWRRLDAATPDRTSRMSPSARQVGGARKRLNQAEPARRGACIASTQIGVARC